MLSTFLYKAVPSSTSKGFLLWIVLSNWDWYIFISMSKVRNHPLTQIDRIETTCGTLLYELQIIWDEVGEAEAERDKVLLELEQECLEVYRRKVDQANRSRAHLRQAIADLEAELASICSVMGERPIHIRKPEQAPESLKDELKAILPQVEEMKKRKHDRRNQFLEVQEIIQNLSNEMFSEHTTLSIVVDENDLSSRKLEECHKEIEKLKREKSDRLMHLSNLANLLNSLCLVLGIDFKQTINEVHPSLDKDYKGTKDISNCTTEKLETMIERLREDKLQKMQRLQDLATSMLELWHLMDTPIEEQQMFQSVTCNIAASEHEITEAGMLSDEFIKSVEAEVSRLEQLKASKLKELVFRKRLELEEICRKTHLIPESYDAIEIAMEAVETGAVNPASVLEEIEVQIGQAKEEAFSRLEILERVEKWLAAREEECWLDEYNMDENRYNNGRGTHLNLKRAEKARALVSKLPGMVEALASKTKSWETERSSEFIYDGIRLLSMLEEYAIVREEKEQERRRRRDQKRVKGQLRADKEVLFGSKSNSPMKVQSVKKASKLLTGGESFKGATSGTTMQSPKSDILQIAKTTPSTKRLAKRNDSTNSNVNDRELEESPTKGNLFMPISSREPSESDDSTNFMGNDSNKFQTEMILETDCVGNVQCNANSSREEESTTLKAVEIHLPSTPFTVSTPTQMVRTPAQTLTSKPIEVGSEDVEVSFEERRTACLETKM